MHMHPSVMPQLSQLTAQMTQLQLSPNPGAISVNNDDVVGSLYQSVPAPAKALGNESCMQEIAESCSVLVNTHHTRSQAITGLSIQGENYENMVGAVKNQEVQSSFQPVQIFPAIQSQALVSSDPPGFSHLDDNRMMYTEASPVPVSSLYASCPVNQDIRCTPKIKVFDTTVKPPFSPPQNHVCGTLLSQTLPQLTSAAIQWSLPFMASLEPAFPFLTQSAYPLACQDNLSGSIVINPISPNEFQV